VDRSPPDDVTIPDPPRTRQHLSRHPQESTLNAEPAAQLRLLDVQALDSKIDQLAHQQRSLPAHAELTALESTRTTLRDRIVAAETEESDVARQQKKADSDVEQVRTRAERDRQRMDSGLLAAKDLENLQHELESLARRQSELEDVELEIMERLEDIQNRLSVLRAEYADTEAKIAAVTMKRDDDSADIVRDREFAQRQREDVARDLPEDLAKLYTKLRADNGGIGAARLHQGRCEGCRLELTATEVSKARAAAADEVLRCEECRRILVRTKESGL
jgi:uncharacterized protein